MKRHEKHYEKHKFCSAKHLHVLTFKGLTVKIAIITYKERPFHRKRTSKSHLFKIFLIILCIVYKFMPAVAVVT